MRGKSSERGFTFIEIMMAVSILGLSTVMIAQSNLTSLGVHARYTRMLSLQSWADQKLWEAREQIVGPEKAEPMEMSGQIMMAHKDCDWSIEVEPTAVDEISLIRLKISWKEGEKLHEFMRVGFAQKRKKQTAAA